MIAKINTTNNPKALINYLFQDKENGVKDRSVYIGSQFCGDNAAEINKEWSRYTDQNPKLKNKAMHLIFSLPEGEKLTDSQWLDFAQGIVTEKMGLQDFAWVAVKHIDTEDRHPHLHIAVCRVSTITGKTLSDRQSYQKGMQISRAAEKKYQLEIVKNPWEKRGHQYDNRKAILRFKIELAAKQSENLIAFNRKLELQNIKMIKGRELLL